MKKKPSWFRTLDLVTIAGPGAVTAGLTVYAMIHGYDGPKQAIPLLWTVTIAFIGIWLRFCQLRKSDLDTFVWFPTYGVMVKPENYVLPKPKVLDALIKKTIDDWTPYFPSAGSIVADGDVIWAWFLKGLNENDKNPAHTKVKGLTIGYSTTMQIDYDTPTDALDKTAFRHELGHVIMGIATGKWDMAVHHAFMGEHGLL